MIVVRGDLGEEEPPVDGADWLLDALAAEGVELIFGNPGSTELPLLDALARQRRIRYVTCLHESVAVGMADGAAQAGDALGTVNLHVQPGLANGLSGVLNAARARVPMLVTVGQQTTRLASEGPFLGGDVLGMSIPPAKAAFEPHSPGELVRDTARAIRTARSHPHGPVVLSLPLDVQVAPAPAPHEPMAPALPPAPPPDRLAAAADALATARAPVVVVGDGVLAARAGPELTRVAERLGAPILGEPMGGRQPVPSDHPLWRGPLPNVGGRIREALAPFDAVLMAAMPWLRIFGSGPEAPIVEGTRLVHLDVDPLEMARGSVPRLALVGDPRAALAGLAERLGPPDAAARARRERTVIEIAGARRSARSRVRAGAGGRGVSADRLALALADAIGPRDLVVDEALTSGRSLRAVLCRRRPETWLAHRGSALGWGLPAAVGAAMADASRRVICLHGDGSALFGIEALWTAAHHAVPLALVIADNGGYEILRAGLEGLTGRPEDDWPGLWLERPSIDLVGLCRAYGASAERVDHSRELRGALGDLWIRAAEGPAALVVGVSGTSDPIPLPREDIARAVARPGRSQ